MEENIINNKDDNNQNSINLGFDHESRYIEIDLAENELTETSENITEIALDKNYEGNTEEIPVLDIVFEELSESLPADDISSGFDEESIFNDISNSLLHDNDEFSVTQVPDEPDKEKNIPKWLIVLCSVFGVLALSCIFLFGTKAGRRMILNTAAEYAGDRMNYDDGSDQDIIDIDDDIDISGDDLNNQDLNIITDDDIDLNTDDIELVTSKDTVNILILGEEDIESYSARGRTDLIMIVSMNTVNKTYSMISLMRDMYVSIPGYQDNKLNAAYQIGGIQLLYKTIEQNFKIELDGYCLVGFDGFEKIIDELGGLTLLLSSKEAEYLRTTNYISKPQFRNVSAGEQILNGNQVLGYCRVRYIPTFTEADDFGRTGRHRIVMNAIFDKIKSLNYFEMIKLMHITLPMITTDLKSDEIAEYIEAAIEIGFQEVSSLRIPAEGTYEMGYVRQMQVLVPNLSDNITLIHNVLFGTGTED